MFSRCSSSAPVQVSISLRPPQPQAATSLYGSTFGSWFSASFPGAGLPLLFFNLPKSRHDEFAVLFGGLAGNGAERIEE